MLTLNDGRSELWQWDTGRKLTVDADCSQVHFSNKIFGRSIDVDVVDGVAIIPDILLQTDKDLTAWAFVGTAENGYTKTSKNLKVNKRNKPADYVFTPPEQTTLQELVERLATIEESQDPNAIKNAVEDYLEQNPVEAPVQSVNGKTGKVNLTAEDVGAISKDKLQEATNEALAQAKASGEFNGKDGIDGVDGKDGKDGKDGYTPVKGVDYFDGKDGADGAPGEKGDKGDKGDPGEKGEQGIQGIPGEKGEKGDTGAPGADGANGKDGTSATHSWNGTVLTITSASGTSSADLKGAKGDTGEKGDKGDKGDAGADGSPGSAGKDGTSVTVSSVTESTESGGDNIVKFSDGKTLTVKNGKDATSVGSYTIPSFWQSAVDTAIATIKSLQVGRNCITFPFFSDNHQRNGYAGMLIAEVMKQCNVPYCFYGGDSISNGTIADEATMIAQDKDFDTMMAVVPNGRLCRAVGNHDGYWYDGTNKYYYNRNQVYELFLREESVAQNKHFGGDGTYYYVDEIASRVRFIVLNTNGGSVDDTQIAWFRDVALKVDEGWAVVIISHQPISNHYHANISNAAAVRAVAVDSGVEIVGWFSGHIHRDRIYTGAAVNTTDDSEGADMGFTQITITSDATNIAYDDATKHTVAEDALSHAIDFVTINRDTRTVNMTRLGIGNNRVYSYDNVVLYSVTNNLSNVVTNNAVPSVAEGSAYTATLTASDGYELKSVTVTMGGVNITSTAYSNGVITIAEVTGNVVITASAEKAVEPVVNIWQTPYKLNSRLNSSESDPVANGMFISAWYPVTQEQLSGDIILRSNKDVFNCAENSGGGDYLRFYPSTTANSRIVSGDMAATTNFTRAYDSKTGIYSLTIKHDLFSEKASEIKYFRWCAQVSTSAITADWFDGCILTINQEIQ